MEHGYHGDTIGTMSAGERGVFNAAYRPLLFNVETIPFPTPGREQETLDAFEHLCSGQEVAALLVEPLILGAGGMKMYPPHVLTELKRIAGCYGSLLIADEERALFSPANRRAPRRIFYASRRALQAVRCLLLRPYVRPRSSTRTCHRIATERSSIPVPTRPTRLLARRRLPTSSSGRMNRF
jgi:hypothetical protein